MVAIKVILYMPVCCTWYNRCDTVAKGCIQVAKAFSIISHPFDGLANVYM